MNLSRRIVQLVVGQFLYGIAIALMVRGTIGVGPWDVFTQGVSRVTGVDFGLLINVIGALVLLLWIPLRQRPGVGTVLNIFLVGPSASLGLALIPVQAALGIRIPLFVGGLLLLAVASGLYIGARFGPGPRDGLMIGLNARFGIPIWLARTMIELTVLLVGWLLGGNVGPGTLAEALLIGPLIGLTLPLFRVPTRSTDEPVDTSLPASGEVTA